MTGQGTPPEDPIIAECLAFYRRAREGLKAVEVDLQHAETLGEPPPAFRAELERYKETLGKLQKAMIRQLNDRLRTTGQGGRLLVTRGVMERGEAFVAKATEAVRAFADFTPENDPHEEHDFGALAVEDVRLFFKIDCYDTDERQGSSDPADPDLTSRVLTILFPDEW